MNRREASMAVEKSGSGGGGGVWREYKRHKAAVTEK